MSLMAVSPCIGDERQGYILAKSFNAFVVDGNPKVRSQERSFLFWNLEDEASAISPTPTKGLHL
jgi:hypothetical protein